MARPGNKNTIDRYVRCDCCAGVGGVQLSERIDKDWVRHVSRLCRDCRQRNGFQPVFEVRRTSSGGRTHVMAGDR